MILRTTYITMIINIIAIMIAIGCAVNIVYASGRSTNMVQDNTDLFNGYEYRRTDELEVTTVTRRAQKLSKVSSAVFVITQDDIKRSGATSIPDALKMASGVQVARIGTDKWSISIRGFNGRYANKLQVLMDGRSVYNPLFAGILWDQQDTLMEDIERIEVIRGPSAAMWGANAVNGVVNIITKKASDTLGAVHTAGGGSFEHGFIGARYGGKINQNTPFRFYAKGFTRDQLNSSQNGNANDAWHNARGGFRLDHVRGIDPVYPAGRYFLQCARRQAG